MHTLTDCTSRLIDQIDADGRHYTRCWGDNDFKNVPVRMYLNNTDTRVYRDLFWQWSYGGNNPHQRFLQGLRIIAGDTIYACTSMHPV